MLVVIRFLIFEELFVFLVMVVIKECNKRGLNFWNVIIIVNVKDVWVEVSFVLVRELFVNIRSYNYDFEKK